MEETVIENIIPGADSSQSEHESEHEESVRYPLKSYSSSWQTRSSFDRRQSYEQHKFIKRDTKFTPFYLRWTYGNTKHIPPINLTTVNRKLVFYASAHAGVLHDYEANEMRLLQGHPNRIKCISADEQGRWVCTSDSGKDNTLIVWDTQNCFPIYNIFNPHGEDYSLQLAAMSKSSKYIVTIGEEPKPIVKVWFWTYGRETPDGSITLEEGYGEAQSIKFNPNHPDHFVITFGHKVVFFNWSENNLTCHTPKLNLKGKGKCNDSTYIYRSHNCITCTSLGRALIWANTIYTCPFDEQPVDNNKFLTKIIRIEHDSINVLKSCDGIVITGDNRGRVHFYDSTMKLLYWFHKEFDSILGLSPNPDKRYFKFVDPFIMEEDDDTEDEECGEGEMPEKNRANLYEKLYLQNVPSDATLIRKPFVMRDFTVFTSKGQIILVKFLEKECQYLTDMADTWITAITTHNEKNLLIIGNADGKLQSYNIRSNSVVTNYILPSVPRESPNDPDFSREISAIQFSPGGVHLACGTRTGALWMLDPCTLEPKTGRPIINTHCLIKKIAFSNDSTFMAYFDISEKVVIYHWKDELKDWILIGKMHSHYKPIRDILFSLENDPETNIPKLFTIGEDRRLVQYDLHKSMENDEIVLGLSERVEQSAIPLCFVWSPIKTKESNFFLVSDNQYKFKLWNDTTAMTHRTVLGPTFGAPVQMMINFPDIPDNPQNPFGKPYIIFATDKHIGIHVQPPTGNPYGYVGMVGHPTQLRQIALSYDGKFLFTLGEDDTCVLKWQVNLRTSDIMHKIGGEGLEPFYCLIDGGQQGWLFNEVKDLFYYMQILHQGENTAVQREVSTVIPISEIPDLMRAVGFYPTEYEVENMIIEVKYKSFNESNVSREIFTEIDFEDFVKLYINHRPAFGIHLTAIKEAFETFASSYNSDDDPEMSRGEFLDILCYTGECFAPETVKSYLTALVHFTEEIEDSAEEEDMFNFLPEIINNRMFVEDVLGIDLNREELCKSPVASDEESQTNSNALQLPGTSAVSINDTSNTKNTTSK